MQTDAPKLSARFDFALAVIVSNAIATVNAVGEHGGMTGDDLCPHDAGGLLTRSEITDLLTRRARGGDRFDMNLVARCHDLEGSDDHGAFSGSFRQFIAKLEEMEATGRYLSKSHTLSNTLIEWRGDRAFSETYHVADEVHATTEGAVHYRIGGRYLDVLRIEDGRWIIEKRAVVYDWSRASPITAPLWETMGYKRHLRGTRGDDDPLYEGRRELRGLRPAPDIREADFQSSSRHGFPMTPSGLHQLLDRQEITDIIYTRARASDRGDAALAHLCYHEGATERHADIIGSASEVIEKGYTRPKSEDGVVFMFHFVSNLTFDFKNANQAFVESYHICHAEVQSSSGEHYDHAIGGRYLDTFERREGRWAIVHRDVVFDWSRRDAVTTKFWDLYPDAPFLFGQRGSKDPLYKYISR